MPSEVTIMSLHMSNLRLAREACLELQKNAIERRPSGGTYIELKQLLKALEGTCRQMGHMRGDSRWFRLATIYCGTEKTIAASRTGHEARAQLSAEALATRYYSKGMWKQFGKLAELFENGLRRAGDLAERKTERAGTLILPPWMMQ
jgi:hypothetical protein